MWSSCRYTFLTDFRQRQQRISSTAILLTGDTLTIYKLFLSLCELINFRTLVGFRQNKTKQIKTNRKKDLTIMMIVAIIIIAITRTIVIIIIIIIIIIVIIIIIIIIIVIIIIITAVIILIIITIM